jgi:hypothetical protein
VVPSQLRGRYRGRYLPDAFEHAFHLVKEIVLAIRMADVCVSPAFLFRMICIRYGGLTGGQDLQFGGGAFLFCKLVTGILGHGIGPSQGLHLHRAAQK